MRSILAESEQPKPKPEPLSWYARGIDAAKRDYPKRPYSDLAPPLTTPPEGLSNFELEEWGDGFVWYCSGRAPKGWKR